MKIEDWNDHDKVIAAGLWDNGDKENNEARGGVKVNCCICGVELVAFPVSVERAKSPDWHLICRDKCLPKLIETTPVTLGGRIRANQIQEIPAEERPVFSPASKDVN